MWHGEQLVDAHEAFARLHDPRSDQKDSGKDRGTKNDSSDDICDGGYIESKSHLQQKGERVAQQETENRRRDRPARDYGSSGRWAHQNLAEDSKVALPATQDGRVFQRYKRRWIVECTISWSGTYRRLVVRYDRSFDDLPEIFSCGLLHDRVDAGFATGSSFSSAPHFVSIEYASRGS